MKIDALVVQGWAWIDTWPPLVGMVHTGDPCGRLEAVG